jgi:dTDP-4-dehydrorhamnose 3,5-epimerase
MFEFIPLSIPGAFEIRGKTAVDDRGTFRKTVHKETFEKHGLNWRFTEQYYSASQRDVIRGLHLQTPPFEHEKLVFCARGRAVDVLLDVRKSSPMFGKFLTLELNQDTHTMVYVPKGVAHGFKSLAEGTTLFYAVTSSHEPSADTGVRWDSFGYDWGIDKPILSARDQALPEFKDFKSPF